MAEKLLADEENGEAADDGGGSDSDEPAKVCCVCFPVLFLVVDSFADLFNFISNLSNFKGRIVFGWDVRQMKSLMDE